MPLISVLCATALGGLLAWFALRSFARDRAAAFLAVAAILVVAMRQYGSELPDAVIACLLIFGFVSVHLGSQLGERLGD